MGPSPSSTASAFQNISADFLAAHGWAAARATPLAADFSARTYQRLTKHDGAKALLMHMPEGLPAFLHMQAHLKTAGMRVPAVFAVDAAQHLALIEDFGEDRFDHLLKNPAQHEELYELAIDTLIQLHRAPPPHAADFTPQRFSQQAGLFLDVYGKLVLKKEFTPDAREAFYAAWDKPLHVACTAPQALILRDYHPANIMLVAGETGYRRAGLIDFQDGGVGPVTYDIASLLEDARRDVDENLRQRMIKKYLAAYQTLDEENIMTSYAILAAQRHTRVLAIVARRWLEKSAPEARGFFYRTWRLLQRHKNQPLLADLFAWLEQHVAEPSL